MEQIRINDNAAIYQAVSDYYEGWYAPSADQMAKCLHPSLAKRSIRRNEIGQEYLIHLTKEMMVEFTKGGGGSDAPSSQRNWTITILDSYEEIATVKVNSPQFVEYIHLAKQDGGWQIVNVLWTANRAQT